MKKKITAKELFEKEKMVFAPCVYDAMTARAAELSGYNCLMLSGGVDSGLLRALRHRVVVAADDEGVEAFVGRRLDRQGQLSHGRRTERRSGWHAG